MPKLQVPGQPGDTLTHDGHEYVITAVGEHIYSLTCYEEENHHTASIAFKDVKQIRRNGKPLTTMDQINPAPWAWDQEYDNNRDEIQDADGRCIAIAWTRRAYPGASARQQFHDDASGQANTALMIRAPELAVALRNILPLASAELDRLRQAAKNDPTKAEEYATTEQDYQDAAALVYFLFRQ